MKMTCKQEIICSIGCLPEYTQGLYLYSDSPESRSDQLAKAVQTHCAGLRCIKIDQVGKDRISFQGNNEIISLRNQDAIKESLNLLKHDCLVVDVTGMCMRICAPILKTAISLYPDNEISIFYAEPQHYVIAEFSKAGHNHDLAETIEGIEPIPGFACIFPDSEENTKLIALLGFEGGRFSYIIDNQDIDNDNIIPVLGVPGYRLEYPYASLWGNKNAIDSTNAWQNMRYAAADSISDAFNLLVEIAADEQQFNFKIAPIGTKPHAIAAVLFALKYPKRVELVYDNPKRENKRTEGIGKIHVCYVSKLFSS